MYMDNAVCLYSLVHCPKAVDKQIPRSRFLKLEKSDLYNVGPRFTEYDIKIQYFLFLYVYTHTHTRSCTVPLNAI
jgi:hypothetical protein